MIISLVSLVASVNSEMLWLTGNMGNQKNIFRKSMGIWFLHSKSGDFFLKTKDNINFKLCWRPKLGFLQKGSKIKINFSWHKQFSFHRAQIHSVPTYLVYLFHYDIHSQFQLQDEISGTHVRALSNFFLPEMFDIS